jgi:hypothetical protein
MQHDATLCLVSLMYVSRCIQHCLGCYISDQDVGLVGVVLETVDVMVRRQSRGEQTEVEPQGLDGYTADAVTVEVFVLQAERAGCETLSLLIVV